MHRSHTAPLFGVGECLHVQDRIVEVVDSEIQIHVALRIFLVENCDACHSCSDEILCTSKMCL